MRFSNSAASMKSQQILGIISIAYASSDSYAKIYSFYKRRCKPDQQLLDSVIKEKPDPRDPVVPRAMFYIDGSILTLGVFQGRNLIFISQHK